MLYKNNFLRKVNQSFVSIFESAHVRRRIGRNERLFMFYTAYPAFILPILIDKVISNSETLACEFEPFYHVMRCFMPIRRKTDS
jgi:hypothetical protein